MRLDYGLAPLFPLCYQVDIEVLETAKMLLFEGSDDILSKCDKFITYIVWSICFLNYHFNAITIPQTIK